jgi:alkanesulfonate monooxygenase SsuD/methylene tetrahydromethanopterin reductase-like flavin-dependent oxidoreductase (luciferase family)
MKFGISIPPFGDFADPLALAETAQQAENAGWDGFFLWDHIIFDPSFHPITDPWVAMTVIALRTTRIRLGALVTPLARRRPWKLARETVALDHVSNGRLIMGVGLGDPVQWDIGFFGEETNDVIRAEKLDESLSILTGLWSGESFGFQGTHYKINPVKFLPRPVQQPRIPIWVGGFWPHKRPMRRAARWDGAFPINFEGITPDEWRRIIDFIAKQRQSEAHFDFVHSGKTSGDNLKEDQQAVEPYIEAGVTWWMEPVDPWRFGWKWEDKWSNEATSRMLERIKQGPPRISSK